MSGFKPEDNPPHLQWATDPAGRRYWIQGVPAFGQSGWRTLFSRSPVPPQVSGMVTVERVEGDDRTEVFSLHCDSLDVARAKAISLAAQIEAGTFEEQTAGG